MALNDPSVPAHAEMARAAQDVGAPAIRQTEQTGEAFVHHGRGGGGNVMKLERVTSHGAGVINAEERDEVDADGKVVPGRRGSTEKREYDERRGRSVGEGRGFELPTGNVAGQEAQQQQQQTSRPEAERKESARRMSGLMNRLRSSSGRRSPSAKRS